MQLSPGQAIDGGNRMVVHGEKNEGGWEAQEAPAMTRRVTVDVYVSTVSLGPLDWIPFPSVTCGVTAVASQRN